MGITLDAAASAADRAMRRFTCLLRSGVDPWGQATADWTVRDVAAHVAGFLPMYTRMLRGTRSPVASLDDLGRFNAGFLAVDEHNLYNLADTIDHEMATIMEEVATVGGDVDLQWHAGLTLPVSAVLGLIGGEGYVHGYDVARTERAPWTIPAEDAGIVIGASVPVLPSLLDAGRARELTGTVEVRLRAPGSGRWTFNFRGGRVTIDPGGDGAADWVLSCSPDGYVLVAYGRVSPLKAMATGQVLGWGRRPGVGMRFTKVFRQI